MMNLVHIANRHDQTELDIASNRLDPRAAFAQAHKDRKELMEEHLSLLAQLYSTKEKAPTKGLHSPQRLATPGRY